MSGKRRALAAILGLGLGLAACRPVKAPEEEKREEEKTARPDPVVDANKPPGVMMFAYAIELDTEFGGRQLVKESLAVRNGDKFRLLIKCPTRGHFYLWAQSAGSPTFDKLHPLAKGTVSAMPGGPESLTIPNDKQRFVIAPEKGADTLIIVFAATPIDDFETAPAEIKAKAFEAFLPQLEAYQPPGMRRVDEGAWVSIYGASPLTKGAIVRRVQLRHE